MVRQGKASDLNFVLGTWVRSYERSTFAQGARFGGMPYARFQDLIAKNIIGRDSCHLTILAWERDEDTIMGWAAFEAPTNERPIVHYAWLREELRGSGLVKLLLAPVVDRECVATHRISRLPEGWDFDWFKVWV
jgi:hypothetical protein